jgi:UDP-2,3-diacylglucosamine pyrophosphatase LpxH
VKNAVYFIGAFEEALAREAREHEVQGVICGHIHYAAMHHDFGIAYHNCGDWVESCTALAEHHDGRFEIIRWAEQAVEARSRTARRRSEPVAA